MECLQSTNLLLQMVNLLHKSTMITGGIGFEAAVTSRCMECRGGGLRHEHWTRVMPHPLHHAQNAQVRPLTGKVHDMLRKQLQSWFIHCGFFRRITEWRRWAVGLARKVGEKVLGFADRRRRQFIAVGNCRQKIHADLWGFLGVFVIPGFGEAPCPRGIIDDRWCENSPPRLRDDALSWMR